MDGGQLKLTEATQLEGSNNGGNGGNGGTAAARSDSDNSTSGLGRILQRGLTRHEMQAQETETIRDDVRQLMSMVRHRLAGSPWELGTSL